VKIRRGIAGWFLTLYVRWSRTRVRTKWGAILTSLYLGTWTTYFIVNRSAFFQLSPNEFGDVCAGLAAPLAFLWFVLGYAQQSEELRLQRRELSLQRREVTRLAQEAKRQAFSAMLSIKRSAFEHLARQISQEILKALEFELYNNRAYPNRAEEFSDIRRELMIVINEEAEFLRAFDTVLQRRGQIWDVVVIYCKKKYRDILSFMSEYIDDLHNLLENSNAVNLRAEMVNSSFGSLALTLEGVVDDVIERVGPIEGRDKLEDTKAPD
jgi:hypothetical protein